MKYLRLILLLVCIAPSANAVIETYEFKDDVARQRYHQFVDELRCPKCQNQNLTGSNAPIAADLRRELHRMLEQGRSDKEIIDYMVGRYGDFVLYRPRFNSETAVLWLAPAGFVIIGFTVLLVIYRRQKNAVIVAADDAPLSDEEQQRLQALLTDEASNQASAPNRNKPHG